MGVRYGARYLGVSEWVSDSEYCYNACFEKKKTARIKAVSLVGMIGLSALPAHLALRAALLCGIATRPL